MLKSQVDFWRGLNTIVNRVRAGTCFQLTVWNDRRPSARNTTQNFFGTNLFCQTFQGWQSKGQNRRTDETENRWKYKSIINIIIKLKHLYSAYTFQCFSSSKQQTNKKKSEKERK